MSEKFNDVVDKAQENIDSLDKVVDKKLDVADAQSVIFAGIDNFQAKLDSMNVSQDAKDKYLAEVAKNLENITGKEKLKAEMKLMNELIGKFNEGVQKDAELANFADSYLANRETGISTGKSFSDIEDSVKVGDLGNYAYAPFLGHMLTDFDDSEWFSFDDSEEREKEYATKTVGLVSANLKRVKEKMTGIVDTSSPIYKKLLDTYKEDTKIMAEIVANVGDFEAEAFRDPDMVGEFAREALTSMSVDEGIKWTKDLMRKIDDNDWQSKGLQSVYGVLANNCRGILQKKLMNVRNSIAKGDTQGVKENTLKVINLAKLFSNRLGSGGFERNAKQSFVTGGLSNFKMLGSAKEGDIDSDLCDPSWAAGMLREVLNFEDVMNNYFEEQVKKPESKFNTKLLSLIEAQLEGGEVDQNAIMKEVSGIATEITEEFLDTGLFGADIAVLEGQLGEGFKYSPEQREAYNLLKDIQGFGALDWSDKTWGYIKEGTKIAGMIAVGIAVGFATGGMSVVATGLIGGAAMTATGAVMNGTGFDDGEFVKTFGTEFMVNSVGFGAGKYLNNLRRAYIAARGGSAASLGTKLLACGGEMVVDIGIGMTADIGKISIDKGMRFDAAAKYFAENPSEWVMSLALPAAFGGGDAIGTGLKASGALAAMGTAFKKINWKLASGKQLHSMDQAMNGMQVKASLLQEDLSLIGKAWKDLTKIKTQKGIDDIVKKLPADRQAKFRENFEKYVEGQKNIYEISKVASDDALKTNGKLSDANRLLKAEELLGRKLNPNQKEALINSYKNGEVDASTLISGGFSRKEYMTLIKEFKNKKIFSLEAIKKAKEHRLEEGKIVKDLIEKYKSEGKNIDNLSVSLNSSNSRNIKMNVELYGKNIGIRTIELRIDDNDIQMSKIFLNKEAQGHGLGLNIYEKTNSYCLKNFGKVLSSDQGNTSPSAIKVWKKLINKGVAKKYLDKGGQSRYKFKTFDDL